MHVLLMFSQYRTELLEALHSFAAGDWEPAKSTTLQLWPAEASRAGMLNLDTAMTLKREVSSNE